MPRLHKYESRDAYYAVTSIDGAVVTYQITPAGEQKLLKAGVVAGDAFDRALLLDLYRTGEAYAPGVEFPEAVWANQLEMDLAGDPNPESAFPVCDGCRSPKDLYLIVTGTADAWSMRLQCPDCRRGMPTPDTMVPLALIDRPWLGRLLTIRADPGKSENVCRYEALLHAEFASRWDAVRKQRQPSQAQLFDEPSIFAPFGGGT
jgi:hypothetical protein